MVDKALFSSNSDEWETPQDLFDLLNREFSFTLDVCATRENAKCAKFNSLGNTAIGLSHPWHGEVCWMNPPYSEIAAWMKKAAHCAEYGAAVVCLVPARTDTKWFQAAFEKASEVRFLKGRLKFNNSKNSAPFPSAIFVFRPGRAPGSNPLVECWDWKADLK